MAKYSLKYKVGLLAGAGEMSAESSSKMVEIWICSSIYSGQAGEDCR